LTRILVVIDFDLEDLGRAAAPIGPPAESALRWSSLYVTMRTHAHESIDDRRYR
jgi:hypothetical protein